MRSPERVWGRLLWDACARTPEGEVCRGPLAVEDLDFRWQPPPAARPRTLLRLDVGAVASPAALGWEAGAGLYPAPWAIAGRLGEARVGLYLRIEREAAGYRGAAGVSALLGIGKR